MNGRGGIEVAPQLQADALYGDIQKRDNSRLKVYNTILTHVHTRIRVTTKAPNNTQQTTFILPEFIPGVPRFDMKECVLYIVWNLRSSGFDVKYTHPNLLWISWQKQERKYRLEESPVTKTLVNMAHKTAQNRLAAEGKGPDGRPLSAIEGKEPKKSSLRKISTYSYQEPASVGRREESRREQSSFDRHSVADMMMAAADRRVTFV